MEEHEFEINFNRVLIDEMKKHVSLNFTEMPPGLHHKSAAKGAGEASITSELYACDKTDDVRIGKNIMADSMYVEFGVIPPEKTMIFPYLDSISLTVKSV